VETLALRDQPGTVTVPFDRPLDGNVKVQFFEVNGPEFGHFESISNALTRLDEGTYGSCTRCGRPLEPDLLAELPWADWCLACEDEQSGL